MLRVYWRWRKPIINGAPENMPEDRKAPSPASSTCRNPNEVFLGELTNWRPQKITLNPNLRALVALSRLQPWRCSPELGCHAAP